MGKRHILLNSSGTIGQSFTVPTTSFNWELDQVFFHTAVTFTDVCTLSVTKDCPGSTINNVLLLNATLSTLAAANLVWQPDRPLAMRGGDRLMFAFGGASATLNWGLEIVINA